MSLVCISQTSTTSIWRCLCWHSLFVDLVVLCRHYLFFHTLEGDIVVVVLIVFVCLFWLILYEPLFCRLDTTVQYVNAWWRILQTTWITSMERNVRGYPQFHYQIYLSMGFHSLMVFHLLFRSKSFGHVNASGAGISWAGTYFE